MSTSFTNTLAIDLSKPVVSTGWYPPEYGDYGYFRWSGPEKESFIDLSIPFSGPAKIAISLNIQSTDIARFPFDVFLNDTPLVCQPIVSSTPAIFVASADVTADSSRLRFVPHAMFTPSDVHPGSTDSRQLGIPVNAILVGPKNNFNIQKHFDGFWYLSCHPDVQDAVEKGAIQSAFHHFVTWGHKESRVARFDLLSFPSQATTQEVIEKSFVSLLKNGDLSAALQKAVLLSDLKKKHSAVKAIQDAALAEADHPVALDCSPILLSATPGDPSQIRKRVALEYLLHGYDGAASSLSAPEVRGVFERQFVAASNTPFSDERAFYWCAIIASVFQEPFSDTARFLVQRHCVGLFHDFAAADYNVLMSGVIYSVFSEIQDNDTLFGVILFFSAISGMSCRAVMACVSSQYPRFSLSYSDLFPQTGAAPAARKAPKCTIVVPLYNAETFIERTLLSIKNQTEPDFECIIVNDKSTDGSVKIASCFVKQDPRFILIHHRANSGLAASRNTGLRAASGRFVCFLDSDDLMMPESIAVRCEAIDASTLPFVIGSYCGSKTIDEDAKVPPHSEKALVSDINFITAGGDCPFNANQPLFITNALRKLGGFNEVLTQAEDHEMWLRVLRAGYVILGVPSFSVTYRARRNSMVRRDPMRHLETFVAQKLSAETALGPEMRYSGAPFFLQHPHHVYLSKANLMARICEFSGMALASGKSPSDVADTVSRHAVDPLFFYMFPQIESWVLRGVTRYTTGTVPENWERSHWSQVIWEFIIALKQKTLACDPEPDHGNNPVSGFEHPTISTECHTSNNLMAPGVQKSIDVVFIPHKDYHVVEIAKIHRALWDFGISSAVIDISAYYRDEGVRNKAKELGLPTLPYSSFVLGEFAPRGVVVFNDWDPIVRGIILTMSLAGVKTVGIVEGIQDYDDVDTGRLREPYKTVQTVCLPGAFDRKYFRNPNQNISVCGIPRVVALRKTYAAKENPTTTGTVLINSNFSYGVLEDVRTTWLEQAVSAVLEVGLRPVISRHPADKGTEFLELQTSMTFYDAVEHSDVVINRFASGILEALAMGRSVIYFKPKKERIDKFNNSMGAYPVVTTREDLVAALRNIGTDSGVETRDAFLDHHAGSMEDVPEQKIAEVIRHVIDHVTVDPEALKQHLERLDALSAAMTSTDSIRDCFLPPYGEMYNVFTAFADDPDAAFVDWNRKFRGFDKVIYDIRKWRTAALESDNDQSNS